MTEERWLKETRNPDPAPMLRWLSTTDTSERKVTLFLIAVIVDQSTVIADNNKAIIEELHGFAEGTVTREDVLKIYREEDAEWFSSVLFGARHAHYAVGKTLSERSKARNLLLDIFGNPFRPITLNPSWLTSTVLALATGIYEERAFDRMPILADALQDAGCDNTDILNHCRQPGEHVRGCWVVDLLTDRK